MTEQEAMHKYTTLKNGMKVSVLGEWREKREIAFPRLTYYHRYVMPYGAAHICSWKVRDNNGAPTGEYVYRAIFKGYGSKVHVVAEEAEFSNLKEAQEYCDKYVMEYIEQCETAYGEFENE